jgi:hypothetical protein
MKRIYCISAIVLLLTCTAPAPAAVKVFLLGGQSNMAGVGGYSGYLGSNNPPWTNPPYTVADAPCPSYLANQSSVKFWNYNDGISPGSTAVHNPSTGNAWIKLQNGYGYRGDQFGPELSFGYRLHELFPNDEIYLVKYGISGTDLGSQWNPYGSAEMFNTFKARAQAAINNLVGQGKTVDVEGMIWMQGESDCTNSSYAAAYAVNLKTLINKVRSDFSAYDGANMKFVTGRITTMMYPYYATLPNCNLVRNAQVNMTDPATPNYVRNTAWFDTDDLTWAYYGHYGTEGQIKLGTRFADAFAPVPEPSALALLAGALMGLVVCEGCRRSPPSRRSLGKNDEKSKYIAEESKSCRITMESVGVDGAM